MSHRRAWSRRDASLTTLVAACNNCASWRHTPDHGHATSANVGFCGRGLFPPEGQPRCESYQITAAFQQKIISTMMKEQGPMAMPVKLMGGKREADKLKRQRAKQPR